MPAAISYSFDTSAICIFIPRGRVGSRISAFALYAPAQRANVCQLARPFAAGCVSASARTAIANPTSDSHRHAFLESRLRFFRLIGMYGIDEIEGEFLGSLRALKYRIRHYRSR